MRQLRRSKSTQIYKVEEVHSGSVRSLLAILSRLKLRKKCIEYDIIAEYVGDKVLDSYFMQQVVLPLFFFSFFGRSCLVDESCTESML